MSKLIFRYRNGVLRPMKVDDIVDPDGLYRYENRTPKYDVKNKHYSNTDAFSIPNVKCRECGKEVFYYENKNGARVLFDFLGPPWPIHPCYESEKNKFKSQSLPVKEDDWFPLIIQKSILLTMGGIRIQGEHEGKIVRFEFDAKDFARMKCVPETIKNMLCFINPNKRSSVQIHNGRNVYKTRFTLSKSVDTEQATNTPVVDDLTRLVQYEVKIIRDDFKTTITFQHQKNEYTYDVDNKILDPHFLDYNNFYIYCESKGINIKFYFFSKLTGCRFDLDSSTNSLINAAHYLNYFHIKSIKNTEDGYLILKGIYQGRKLSLTSQNLKLTNSQVLINNIRSHQLSLFIKKTATTENGTDTYWLNTKDKEGKLRYEGFVVCRSNILSMNESTTYKSHTYYLSPLMKPTGIDSIKIMKPESSIKAKVKILRQVTNEEILVSLVINTSEISLIIKSNRIALSQLDIDMRAIGADVRIGRNNEEKLTLIVNKNIIGVFTPTKQVSEPLVTKTTPLKKHDIQNTISKNSGNVNISTNVIAHAFIDALKVVKPI